MENCLGYVKSGYSLQVTLWIMIDIKQIVTLIFGQISAEALRVKTTVSPQMLLCFELEGHRKQPDPILNVAIESNGGD